MSERPKPTGLYLQQMTELMRATENHEKLIYSVRVQGLEDSDREMQDIPEAYAVVENPDAVGGCVVYGWSKGKWYSNPSLRWLVRHLIKELKHV